MPSVMMMAVELLMASTFVDSYTGKVLLVSMDGFRWDYVNKISGLTNFSKMAASGVTVDYVNNTFVTKTFPCHYSIMTGLFEESHGIVGNTMYDPEHNATFGKNSIESFWFDGGEPLWVTTIKQNKKAGVFFWPGSEAEIRGHRPTLYMKYNESIPFEHRINTALGWFTEQNMSFVAMYFNEPDTMSHKYGPDSQQVADKVREMDGVLGKILDTMDAKNLSDSVNVIVVSDHGMTDSNLTTQMIDMWEVVNSSLVERVVDSGVVTAIIPAPGREQELVETLRNQSHVTVYRKDEIPDRFHYKNHPRIMPVIVLADEGWQFSANVTTLRRTNMTADHGYSNELTSMRAIFFARGPDFKKGVKGTSIRLVDIYPLVCKLLNIQPAPNNGSLDNTAMFLEDPVVTGRASLHLGNSLVALLIVTAMISLIS
ncbi:bis(5'-adenosyl)-triphosphatase enpp4-like isoform X2 [Pomacea canaliculata]|uniref:bis(5'-adenosyl)-triphosphatase enpp4-like isoform X2 n=1 Tax=Pomacea canaliculata TaxID=400727 RepID=UPI000D73FA7A|nr:bis(5'-adenosyl)-triphosphatase enpp4-like isoform X2 [Pomacea canaliculata]